MDKHSVVSTPTHPPIAVGVDEAGRLLGLSGETISRAIRAGELPAARFGRAVRVVVTSLSEWAKSKETSAVAESEANGE